MSLSEDIKDFAFELGYSKAGITTADSNWAAGQENPLAYLESFFKIDRADVTGNGVTDTRVYLDMDNDGNAEWSVVLADNDLTADQVFAAMDISVNGTLIG